MSNHLAVLQAHGDRIVRAVAKTTGEVSDALLGFLRDERATWTLPQWKIVLRELDTCELTVEAWLAVKSEKEDGWLK